MREMPFFHGENYSKSHEKSLKETNKGDNYVERYNTFTHGKKQCESTKSSQIKTIISIKIPRGFGRI